MKVYISAMFVALIMVAVAGCAASPGAPTASSRPATATAVPAPAVATAAQVPAAASGAPIGPTVVATDEAAALAQAAHDLGYAKKLLDGKTVYYCKSDATLGTRFSSTKCYTEDQMSAVVQRSIANRQSVAEMEHKTMNQPGGS